MRKGKSGPPRLAWIWKRRKKEAVYRGNDWGHSPGENQDERPVQRSYPDAGTYHEHGTDDAQHVDYLELFQKMMEQIAEDTHAYYRML